MTWRHIVPSLLTLMAMMAGFFSIMMSAASDFIMAAQLIMVSLILDGLDGTLARLLKGTSEFGGELDTFVDMTSFGLAPAALLYQLTLKDHGLLGAAMASLIVMSGVIRLSRFRVIDPFRGQQGYLGLPITTAATWIAMWVLITNTNMIQKAWFTLEQGPLAIVFWTVVLIMMFLQVSLVRYNKPTKDPMIFVPFSLLIILLFMRDSVAVPAALILSTYAFCFAFISPFFFKPCSPCGSDQAAKPAQS